MQFKFAGNTYFLEFQREYKHISTTHNGKTTTVRSTYPYTTAKLLQASSEPKTVPHTEVAKATVGCMPGDKYSNAAGRLFALRALTSKLRPTKGRKGFDREFREAMWTAYVQRGKQKAPVAQHSDVIDGVATRVVEGPQQPLTVADQNGLDDRVIH
jgi:hypothetical protein